MSTLMTAFLDLVTTSSPLVLQQMDLQYLPSNAAFTILLQIPNNQLENSFQTYFSKIEWLSNLCLFPCGISIVLLMVTLFIFIRQYKKIISKYKDNKQLLNKQEQEAKVLLVKVNDAFEEVIQLARSNHPNFYVRFQECYPQFEPKLLRLNPNLQNSELTLLAYIYLNFQTKEIADYTFKSVKTIQNRKHLLRKKLNIQPSVDLYVWLRS
ncbi:helix-turn-helix transcriptional regulator [Sphingobacterium lactis]|uniref:helix-turn-helix transcriptional regulator n=1 Tax=Sphingobacterium lactis TaxID=797291 RepID=UPI003EC8D3EF